MLRALALPPAGRRRPLHALVLAVVAASWLAYVLAPPLSPDFAAQLARARAVDLTGSSQWWTGWFGGLSLPSYSVVTPWLMAFAGAPVTGATAGVVALAGAWVLLQRTPRPVWGVLGFALLDAADLVVGRVTFAVGLAAGLWAVVALARGRGWRATAASLVLAVGACLGSPLAGMFTGLALVAVVLADRERRRRAALVAGVLLSCAGLLAVLFPSSGTMPTPPLDVLPALGTAVLVALACPQPVVRTTAALTAATTVVFTLVPGAVGMNITRLSWLAATPAVLACAQVPRWLPRLLPVRSSAARGALLALVAVVSALTPGVDVVQQLTRSTDPSTSPAFYSPLVRALERDRAAHPGDAGARAEVVDPRTHWPSLYVADRVPLARGWDRQADAAYDPIFYTPGALTADSYTAWLRSLSVAWVAVPHGVPLDYASVGEARLVARGVPALHRVWSSRSWTLYRVSDPAPVVTGARLVSITPSGASVAVAAAGTVTVRVRWDPSLAVFAEDGVSRGEAAWHLWAPLAGSPADADPTSGAPVLCPVPSVDGMVSVVLPAGRWRIAPDTGGELGDRWTGACAGARRAAAASSSAMTAATREVAARREDDGRTSAWTWWTRGLR